MAIYWLCRGTMLLGLRVRKKPYHRVYYECCNAWKQAAMLRHVAPKDVIYRLFFSPSALASKKLE